MTASASASTSDHRWAEGVWACPDPRTEEDLPQDRAISVKQTSTIGRHDEAKLLDLLRGVSRSRLARSDLVQCDVVTDGDTVTALVATGQLIVRTSVLEASEPLRSALEQAGFTRTDVPAELDGHVECLTKSEITPNELEAFARDLRRQGHPVSVNHITPLGYWVKSEDGPEHTAWRQDPPAPAAAPSPIVAVIDTGIVDAKARTDGWLAEIVRDPTPETGNVDELDGPDMGGELDLGAGHGTFAAGIVRQVAPNAKIEAIKALDTTGIGSEVSVAAAMVRAVRAGAQIINLSLGTRTFDDQPPVAIEVALELIDAHVGEHGRGDDVLIVAAAGNIGDTRPCWPAAFERIVSVAALTAAGQPAPWSSHGPWVNCSTVGEGVASPFVPGVEAAVLDKTPDKFDGDDWAIWAGTSFAAPQIAGLAARVVAEQGLAPREACAVVIASGYPIPDYGRAVRILPGT